MAVRARMWAVGVCLGLGAADLFLLNSWLVPQGLQARTIAPPSGQTELPAAPAAAPAPELPPTPTLPPPGGERELAAATPPPPNGGRELPAEPIIVEFGHDEDRLRSAGRRAVD